MQHGCVLAQAAAESHVKRPVAWISLPLNAHEVSLMSEGRPGQVRVGPTETQSSVSVSRRLGTSRPFHAKHPRLTVREAICGVQGLHLLPPLAWAGSSC